MTNYICCADLHLTSNKPILRTETDFLKVCIDKVNQIIELANEYKADILIAGDLFHSYTVSYKVLNEFSNCFNNLHRKVLFVDGQHDRENHTTNFINTPIYSLNNSKSNCFFLQNTNIIQDKRTSYCFCVYGASWKSKISTEIKDNILLVHKCITPEKPPFFLKDAISAKEMLKKYSNFKYIITGDYHESFMCKYKGRVLINPGSMTRMKIDQLDHEPSVYLLDTDKDKVKRIKLKVRPAKKVFNLTKSEKDKDFKKFQEEIKDLVQALKIKSKSPNYLNILNQIIKKSKTNKSVQKIINRSMQ